MAKISCCYKCEKKKGGCKPTCPDYIIEKAFSEVEREERNKQKQLQYGLYNQRDTAVRKYFKTTRKGYGRNA